MVGKVNTEKTKLLKADENQNQKREPNRLYKEASRKRKAVILACCFVMQMMANGVGFGLGVMYVEIQRVFDAPRAEAALVQSIFMGLMTAGGLIYGPFIKKYGPGVCVMAGTTIGCLGLFASIFSTNIYLVILFSGVIAGLGLSINYLAPFITTSLVFHENAGVPLVFLTTGSSIGQFIFPYAYEIFISEYGWSGAYILVSAIALNCVPAGFFVHMSRDFMRAIEEQPKKEEDDTKHCCRCLPGLSLLLDFKILLILTICFLLASTGKIESWFLVDLMTSRGYERQTGSLLLSLIGFLNFFGRATGVVFRFKLRVPTIYHWIYCTPILALSHFLILRFTDYLPLLLSCLLYGYIFGISVAQSPAIMFETAGLQRYASGMGFVNFCYGVGNFLGGFVGGNTTSKLAKPFGLANQKLCYLQMEKILENKTKNILKNGIIKDIYGSYAPMFYSAIGSSFYMCLACVIVIILMRRQKQCEERQKLIQKTETKYDSVKYSVIKDDSNC